jgi:TatD DNase family protein
VVKEIPATRLLIETDAPYLAPQSHRGRRNEPAWVADVCAAVAEVRGVKDRTVARRTRDNFRELFGL